MTYKQRQQALVIDYNNGVSVEELAKKYSFTIKNVNTLVKLKRLQINPDFFNVDEHDCWLIPTSSQTKIKNTFKTKTYEQTIDSSNGDV